MIYITSHDYGNDLSSRSADVLTRFTSFYSLISSSIWLFSNTPKSPYGMGSAFELRLGGKLVAQFKRSLMYVIKYQPQQIDGVSTGPDIPVSTEVSNPTACLVDLHVQISALLDLSYAHPVH